MTQNERVLRHLREVGALTGAQAMRDYGIAHLASRISELRAAGVNIIGTTETAKNRYGETVRFMVYRLEE